MSIAMPLRSVHVRRCGSIAWSVATAMGLWLVLGTLVAVRATGPDDVISFHPFSQVDFRDSVWLPVLHFMDGGIPWDRPNFTGAYPEVQFYPLYVPSYWWLTAPLLLLPYRMAAVLWTGLLVGCLVWMVHRSLTLWFEDTVTRNPWLVPAVTAASLLLRPVQTSLSQGNWALLCAAGSMLALIGNCGLPDRRIGLERWFSPVVLGTCVAIVKPNIGLPLLLALAITGRAREAGRALGLTAMLGLPIGLVVAQRAGGVPQATHILLTTLRDGDGAQPGDTHYTRLDLSATIGRILDNPYHPAVVLGGIALASVLTLGFGAIAVRRWGVLDARAVTLLALATAVVTPNLHYALLAALPALVALCAASLRLQRAGRSWLAAVPAVDAGLVGLVMLSPVRGGSRAGLTPQLANMTYGVVLLLAVLLAAVWVAEGLRRAVLVPATSPGSRSPGPA